MQVKVYDTVSKHERTVTKKAFDIINRARRKQPRYQVLEYLDDEGNSVNAPQTTQIIEKKKEEEVVAPAVGNVTEQSLTGEPEQQATVKTGDDTIYEFSHPINPTIIEKPEPKKRGRKPKNKIENA